MTEPTNLFMFTLPGHRIVTERVDPHHFDGDDAFEGASVTLTEYEGDEVRERYGYEDPLEAYGMFLEMALTWVELEQMRPSVALDGSEPGQLCVFDAHGCRIVAERVGPDHFDDDDPCFGSTYMVTEYSGEHIAERFVFTDDSRAMYDVFLDHVSVQIDVEMLRIGARTDTDDTDMLDAAGAML